ncbi:GyrI-like domain-containing protein [Pontibacter anaerobius]|uniref:GyrI-like domain-containing protein n=1 Tax=Pontibacter anaerobius TaxID=2993940 RepID=A0ABT3RF64_9BACT|nr:GyrI-like domain-containing protein [Pontibacter anaerobius]MCX2740474.1 GyrI-like domain-containing protein [Pontibacter anaerobius]
MKKLFYVVAGFAIVLLVFYTYLGGFAAPDVTLTTSETMYVAGQPFEGSVEDEAMGQAFQRVSEVLQDKALQGHPANIYYNDPDKSGDSIRAFIGIIIPDSTAKLPAGYTLRTVPGGRQVVRAEATASIALLPKKLYAAVFDYAKEEKLKLEEFYVEWFPEDDKGVLEVPVKE